MKERFLLCRPQGGLNDILCRIKLCYDYAKQFNRTLIIDTLTRTYLNCNFGTLFEFVDKNVITQVNTEILDFLSKQKNFSFYSKWPCIANTNQVSNLDFVNNSNIDFNNAYQFDFNQDLDAKVLYYQRFGKGLLLSYRLLKQQIKSINPKLVKFIVSLLPTEPYFSIHIRHTDYISVNYIEYIQAIKPKLKNKKILICTDSLTVKKSCDELLSEYDIFYLSSFVPTIKNKPLHSTKNIKFFKEDDKDFIMLKEKNYPFDPSTFTRQTIFSLIDLFGLFCSKRIFFPEIIRAEYYLDDGTLKESKTGKYTSGYTTLALNIQRDQQLKAKLLRC